MANPYHMAKTTTKTTKTVKKTDKKPFPLGLPKGSIRSLITVSTLFVYFVAVFLQMIMGKIVPESLNSIVITVVAFYFGVRSAETRLLEDTSKKL